MRCVGGVGLHFARSPHFPLRRPLAAAAAAAAGAAAAGAAAAGAAGVCFTTQCPLYLRLQAAAFLLLLLLQQQLLLLLMYIKPRGQQQGVSPLLQREAAPAMLL